MGPALHRQEGVVGQPLDFPPELGSEKLADGAGDAIHRGLPFFGGDVELVFMLEEPGDVDGIGPVGAGARIAEFAPHQVDLAGLGGRRDFAGRVAPRVFQEEFDGLVGVVAGPLLAGGKALEAVEFPRARRRAVVPAAPGGVVGEIVALEAGLERFVPRVRPGKFVGQGAHGAAGFRRRLSMSRRQSWARPPVAVSR